MPSFIVIGHKVRTNSDFTLNDLAGSTGRLDVLLRCINSAFMLSNDIRRDVDVYLILLGEPDPPKTLRFDGGILQHLNPDERSTGALVKSALDRDIVSGEVQTSPGVFISKDGLAQVLEKFKNSRLIYLKEEGEPLRGRDIEDDDVFILGGQTDLTAEEEELVRESGDVMTVSLGSKSLHADHCITVVLNELDPIFDTQFTGHSQK